MDTADEVWEQLKIATSKNDIDLVEVLSAKLRKLNNKQEKLTNNQNFEPLQLDRREAYNNSLEPVEDVGHTSFTPLTQAGTLINVRIVVVNSAGTENLVQLQLHSATTISELKVILKKKCSISEENQRWILGRQCPLDDVTLQQCDVKDDYVIFVYCNSDNDEELPLETKVAAIVKQPRVEESNAKSLIEFLNCANCNSSNRADDTHCMECCVPLRNRCAEVREPSEELKASWTCRRCTYENRGSNSICDLCEYKPGNDGSSSPGATDQNVGKSVSVNHIPGSQCDTNKEYSDHDIAEQYKIMQACNTEQADQWKCTNCTFFNIKKHKFCDMCGKENSEHEPSVNPSNIQEDNTDWACPQCTFLNHPIAPLCKICEGSRPATFKVPASMSAESVKLQQFHSELQETADNRLAQNYSELLQTDHVDLIRNQNKQTCPICLLEIGLLEGVILRECLHFFCQDCLADHIGYSEEAEVLCPFKEDYSCQCPLLEREVKALVNKDVYSAYQQRSLSAAENQSNSYHCRSVDCSGWGILEDDINEFLCDVCQKVNCLACKCIHHPQTCKQYQDNLRINAQNNESDRKTQQELDRLLASGEAMHCPGCQVILQKREGCDWMKCTMCKTEICWATKGPRWGPKGQGDTSSGCRCRLNGIPCIPSCRNCH